MPDVSTEVSVPQSAEVEAAQAAVDALIAQQQEEFSDDLFSTPILKIGQPLTREVLAEAAEAGDFINTLTGESIGTKIGFIVAYYQQGRFASDRDSGRAYAAFGSTIPDHWSDLVGDEFVGSPFTEYPDAEECYKARVNAKEIEWGKGPIISTTHNFTGLALVSSADPDEPDDLQPVRLSLKRIDVPAAKKIITIQRSALRNRPFWDKTFEFGTEKKAFAKGAAHMLTVRLGRDTTPDEKVQAVELATAVAAGRVSDNQVAADGPASRSEPAANGGLGV